jgi:tetratricopeptide (TPR) repeat protein
MIQLDLFGWPAREEAPLEERREPEVDPAGALDPPDPRQIDLFDARGAQLRASRAAVAREDLEGARALLADLLARGADPEARRAMARIAAVEEGIGRTRGLPASAHALALLAYAGELDDAAGLGDALRAVLRRRAARAVQAEHGDDALLVGWPVGVYHARAGDLAAARASLTAALARTRRARTLYALGDVAAQEGDLLAARACYCEALARDPFDAEAVSAIRDREILELPDIARYELEIERCPEVWSAPLGMITGVFRIPRALELAPAREDTARSREQREARAAAQRFTAAIVAAELATNVIEARREMKRIQPALFAAYLEQRSARRGAADGDRAPPRQ